MYGYVASSSQDGKFNNSLHLVGQDPRDQGKAKQTR